MALAGLLALAGCGGAAEQAPERTPGRPTARGPRIGIHPEYRALRLDLPRDQGSAGDVFLCDSAPAVVLGGGVYAPGEDRWLIPRRDPPIERADCDHEGNLYVVSGRRLARVGTRAGQTSASLGTLPGPGFRVAWSGASLLLWGRGDESWMVVDWAPASGPLLLWTGATAIDAADRIGPHALVAAAGSSLTLIAGTDARAFAKLAPGVDAIAVDVDGSVYTSSARGIERHRGEGPPELIAEDLRGPLRVRLGTVHVLARERGVVLRLDPSRGR